MWKYVHAILRNANRDLFAGAPMPRLRSLGDNGAEDNVSGGELMKFDRVITNPPFSQNYTREGIPFPERFKYGWTPEGGKKADQPLGAARWHSGRSRRPTRSASDEPGKHEVTDQEEAPRCEEREVEHGLDGLAVGRGHGGKPWPESQRRGEHEHGDHQGCQRPSHGSTLGHPAPPLAGPLETDRSPPDYAEDGDPDAMTKVMETLE